MTSRVTLVSHVISNRVRRMPQAMYFIYNYSVTEGRTNRQTDGRTDNDANAALCNTCTVRQREAWL